MYGNPNVIWGNANITIGNFCSFGNNVSIYLGGNFMKNWVTAYPFGNIYHEQFNTFNGVGNPTTKGDVIIGNDVSFGDNVTIMSGVTIGDGAIIANNSNVVSNIEPYSLVGGNPAKLIKYRFKTDQIDKLLEIKWWNWDDEKINKFIPLLCDSNIDDFIVQSSL